MAKKPHEVHSARVARWRELNRLSLSLASSITRDQQRLADIESLKQIVQATGNQLRENESISEEHHAYLRTLQEQLKLKLDTYQNPSILH